MIYHINSVFNRANSTLGFLRRNLRRCPAPLKETAYITLVRSIMEYAAPIWDPHLSKDSHMLENIQRRAARFIKGDFRTTASVTKMLLDLGLKDLKDRRRDLRLALLFKVVQDHVGVSPEDIGLEPADGRTRANHKHKFRTRGARTNSYKFSFASRTISEWNRLPANIVEADSPQAFKAGLATLAPVAPEMPWSGTHRSALYTTGWPADNRPRQDKTSWVVTSVTLTFDLWPWPFAWTLLWSLVITPENFMMIRWWEHSQKGVTDRQTDRWTDGKYYL